MAKQQQVVSSLTAVVALSLVGIGSVLVDAARRDRPFWARLGGAAAHVLQSLKPGGSWMTIEPMAGDKLEDNLNPVGRIYYAGSTMGCVPTSLSQKVRTALGAQAGEAKLREVIIAGGFRDVRRAAETPFNMILEARP
jgi:hypothetical protein